MSLISLFQNTAEHVYNGCFSYIEKSGLATITNKMYTFQIFVKYHSSISFKYIADNLKTIQKNVIHLKSFLLKIYKTHHQVFKMVNEC